MRFNNHEVDSTTYTTSFPLYSCEFQMAAHLRMTHEQSDMSCSSAMIPLTGDTLQERKGQTNTFSILTCWIDWIDPPKSPTVVLQKSIKTKTHNSYVSSLTFGEIDMCEDVSWNFSLHRINIGC